MIKAIPIAMDIQTTLYYQLYMSVLRIRKTAFLIFFCNFLLTCQDFLEYYKPRPGLPKPLNEWLTYVQEHKTDFKFINNIVKRRKEEQDYYDDEEEKSNYGLLQSNEEEYIDEVPLNDIHPYHTQETDPFANFVYNKHKNYNKNFNNYRGFNRMRRESSKKSFFEHNNPLEIEPNGKYGEIKRIGEKYPEQYRNKDQQAKREIQIDVLNDGKLIKSIKESDTDSKSILLNIDSLQNPHYQLEEKKIPIKKSTLAVPNLPIHGYPYQQELQPTTTDVEKALNYNNLFTINKDLNTDRSMPKNVLMYHVTVPSDIPVQDTTILENISGFHQNNFRDMSKYWSDSEKHQLQKGIQFAHNTADMKNLMQSIPKTNAKLTDGFEPVNSIVVDHSHDKEFPKKVNPQYQQYSKRNLAPLQGTVQFQDKDNVLPLDSSLTPVDLTVGTEPNESTTVSSVEIVLNQQENKRNKNDNKNIEDIQTEAKDLTPDHLYDVKSSSEKTDQELLYHHASSEKINKDVLQPQVSSEKPDLSVYNNKISSEKPITHNKISSEKPKQELFHHHNNEIPNNGNAHHGNENINNRIDITIIQPQEDDKNAESVEVNQQENVNSELHKEVEPPLEEEINNEQETNNEQECENEQQPEEELATGDVQGEEQDTMKDVINEEINHQQQVEDDIYQNQSNEEPGKPELFINQDCTDQEKVNIPLQEDIPNGDQVYKTKEQEKVPTVKLLLDISTDAHNKRNLNKVKQFEKRNSFTKKRPISCQGKNCKTRFRAKQPQQLKNSQSNKKKFKSYKTRQLKSLNYIYDTDIEAPNDEEYSIIDEVSSERNLLSSINKKNAVEGDYGDEEDSFTVRKNDTNKIIKETKNEFANPRTDSTREDDDDFDYYEEEAPPKRKNQTREAKYRPRERNQEFGKHMHPKPKIVSKPNKPNTGNKEMFEDKEGFVREPRSQDAFEDFQQLPKFVMNDRIEEENLRKRSLNSKKEAVPNKFPLSSKGFFTHDSKQSEFKRSSSDNLDILDKASAPSLGDGVATALAPESMLGTSESGAGTTILNFHELPGAKKAGVTSSLGITTECSEVSIDKPCENEKFEPSDIELTTLLSIIPEVEMQMVDNGTDLLKNKDKFEKLDDALSGELPISLVNTIYEHLRNNTGFRTRLFKGMKRRFQKLPITSDDIQVVTREQNKKMLNIMETIINKLEWNSNCQTIPNRYKQYLTSITSAKTQDVLTKTKQMEEVNFDDSQNFRNYLFNHEDGASSNALLQKAKVLKDMLEKFEQLPPDCKARAEPVKKYVEEHLMMLDHVNELIKSQKKETESETEPPQVTVQSHQKPKRRNEEPENLLIQEQLDSLGLGKNHNFKPKFDLDEMVEKSKNNNKRNQRLLEGKIRKTEKKSKRELVIDGSKQYQKLVEAVKRERLKREAKRRLAETFGKLTADDAKGDNVIREIFESPVVYTL